VIRRFPFVEPPSRGPDPDVKEDADMPNHLLEGAVEVRPFRDDVED
jgi:hypothetical protein